MTAERGLAEAQFIAQNRAWLDYWLLQRFPGKTLEELDAIDWPRLMQAVEIERIVSIETKRAQLLAGELKRKHFKSWELRRIAEHDELLERMGYDLDGSEYDDDGDGVE